LIKEGSLFDYSVADVRALRKWLKSKLPDLDARDRQQEVEERHRVALPGHRVLSRSRARSIAKMLNGAAIVYTAAVFFVGSRGLIDGTVFRVAALIGLLVVPVTLAIKSWSASSFQFGSFVGGGSPPSIDGALMFGALFPVAMTWGFCQPLVWSQLWVPAALVSGALIVVAMKFALSRRDHVTGTLVLIVIMLILYGGGGIATANAALDCAIPTREIAAIVGREVRSQDCYWTLRFGGRSDLIRKVHVSRRLYRAYDVASHAPVPVTITVGHGALRIAWIVRVGS